MPNLPVGKATPLPDLEKLQADNKRLAGALYVLAHDLARELTKAHTEEELMAQALHDADYLDCGDRGLEILREIEEESHV